MTKPAVWYLPTPAHTSRVFRETTYARFLRIFDVAANASDTNFATADVEAGAAGFEAVVTGWGTPQLSAKVFEVGADIRIVAHSAGSPRAVVDDALVRDVLIPRAITLFSANLAIALNVAEHTVGMMIVMSRRVIEHALTIRNEGVWRHPNLPQTGQFLRGATVGIVSASKVGREVLKLLKPFDVRVLVHDPFLSEYEAGALGVEKAELNDLFRRCDIVSIHAPSLPATRRMIGAQHLRLLRDGAVLINTSRGAVLDQQALYEEAKTGRIFVHLDVTDPEPPSPDEPLRILPNVVITPHISGAGTYGYHEIGESTVRALEDFFSERTVQGRVDLNVWDRIP